MSKLLAAEATLVRVDLRFSGSFSELDSLPLDALPMDMGGYEFECDDDELLEDLADALFEFGVEPDELAILEVEGEGFRAPAEFDIPASRASGWPRFQEGASFLRFLVLPEMDDVAPLLRAVKEAYSMSFVRLKAGALVAYDESPTVAVNRITDPSAPVDTRPEHERLADALVSAVKEGLERT